MKVEYDPVWLRQPHRLRQQKWRYTFATARRRKAQEDQDVTCRRARAWALARRAATLLREQFGATRVVLFGSLVYEDGFTLFLENLARADEES